jgi:putative transcriptional regulator
MRGMEFPQSSSLAEQFLIAMPAMGDPHFSRGLTLLCQHDEHGAMGLVINRLSEYCVGDVLSQMGIETRSDTLAALPVLAGGPVNPERGFVLHDDPRPWDSTLVVREGLYVTTSRDILEAMARGDGPARSLVTLGFAGWEAGQLESELLENAWLTLASSEDLIFSEPLESRWQSAVRRLGVDPGRLTDYAGHA